MDIDTMTGVPRPRSRRIWIAVGSLLPIVVIGGGAALFIHTFIAPIVRMPEPSQLAAYTPTASAPAPAPVTEAEPQPPSHSALPSSSPLPSGFNTASFWPTSALTPTPGPAYAPSAAGGDIAERVAGPIPLPLPRPRTAAAVRGSVPLPRPRPGAAEPD